MFSYAQDGTPVPVSEYAEKTGPNTITFLSYPKYYTNAEGKLTLVDTNLVASEDPKWDFQVTTGIWTLRVRTDGTFQAEHAGDVFTYRLAQIGVGRGESFRAFEWGEPNWKNYQVIGDSLCWTNVFPDVDLVVRYIHDILKVDVVLKKEVISSLHDSISKGALGQNIYLSTKFDLLEAMIVGEIQQGGKTIDPNYGSQDTNAPLLFTRNEDVFHTFRPVEAYWENGDGTQISLNDGSLYKQFLQLNKNSAGLYEISIPLDLSSKEVGQQCVLSSSMLFEDPAQSVRDAQLIENDMANLGTSSVAHINGKDRYLIGFSIGDVLDKAMIRSAKIVLTADASRLNDAAMELGFYKMQEEWDEAASNWFTRTFDQSWETSSIANTEPIITADVKAPFVPYGRSVKIDATSIAYSFDVTQLLKGHLYDGKKYMRDHGFLLKQKNENNDSQNTVDIATSESLDIDFRPMLLVTTGFTKFGASVGSGYDTTSTGWTHPERLTNLANDKLELVRYFFCKFVSTNPDPVQRAIENTQQNQLIFNQWISFAGACSNSGVKIVLVLTAGLDPALSPNGYYSSATDYANYVEDSLEELENNNLLSTLYAVELGAEEDGGPMKWTKYALDGLASAAGGAEYAEYYLSAWDRIRSHTSWDNIAIIGGGSVEDWKQICNEGPSYRFLSGFLTIVTGPSAYWKIPDILAFHTYSGDSPQEGLPKNIQYPWYNILESYNKLYTMCSGRNYYPNFAITEYGLGASYFDPSYILDCGTPHDFADSRTQANYYLRSLLLHSLYLNNGVGIDCNTYWNHCRVQDNQIINFDDLITHEDGSQHYGVRDWGFHNFDTMINGESRKAMSYVSRLLDTATNLDFYNSSNSVWIPLRIYSIDQDNYVEYAYCGFRNNYGYWLVVWAYTRSNDYHFEIPHEYVVDIELDSNYSYDPITTYQFTITPGTIQSKWLNPYYLPYDQGSATFEPVTPSEFSANPNGAGKTVIHTSITNNPLFIYIEK